MFEKAKALEKVVATQPSDSKCMKALLDDSLE